MPCTITHDVKSIAQAPCPKKPLLGHILPCSSWAERRSLLHGFTWIPKSEILPYQIRPILKKRAPTPSNMGPEQIADWPEKTADWLETIGDWPITIAESFFALSVAFAWMPACKFSEYASQLCSPRFLLFLKAACSASGSDSAVKSNWKRDLRSRSNISATDKLLIKSPIKTLGFISSQRHLLQRRSVHTGCSTGKSENGFLLEDYSEASHWFCQAS